MKEAQKSSSTIPCAGRSMRVLPHLFSLILLTCVLPVAQAQDSPEPKPVISDRPLSTDQLAIYRVVLSSWMENGKGKHPVHLSIQTTPFQLDDMDAGCGKKYRMTEGAKGEVHRFRVEDLPQLGPSKVELVDREAQSKEVEANDPDKSIHGGKSIEDAVAKGFAHGLVTLGEIHFDQEHTHAIVWYGFTCGRLCGNGATVILEKKNGEWSFKDRCSTWISVLSLPTGLRKS